MGREFVSRVLAALLNVQAGFSLRQYRHAGRSDQSRRLWSSDGFPRFFPNHALHVAFGVYGFSRLIDFRGFKIDRFLADRAIEVWMSGTLHRAPP
jgi:hypothetical protein